MKRQQTDMFRASQHFFQKNSRAMLSSFLRKTPTLSVRHFHCQSTLFAEVSADVVKQLRKLTDAPLGQCRKALEESV